MRVQYPPFWFDGRCDDCGLCSEFLPADARCAVGMGVTCVWLLLVVLYCPYRSNTVDRNALLVQVRTLRLRNVFPVLSDSNSCSVPLAQTHVLLILMLGFTLQTEVLTPGSPEDIAARHVHPCAVMIYDLCCVMPCHRSLIHF